MGTFPKNRHNLIMTGMCLSEISGKNNTTLVLQYMHVCVCVLESKNVCLWSLSEYLRMYVESGFTLYTNITLYNCL